MPKPIIDISFKKLANTAVKRSARGVVAIIVRDDTNKTFSIKEYKQSTDVEPALFTAANAQLISDCFVGSPGKVIVIRIDIAALISVALVIATGLKFDYIGGALIQADQTAIGVWAKGQAALKKTFKAITWGSSLADSECVINLQNTSVVFNDARATKTGEQFVPTLLGLVAGTPLDKSVTYMRCTTLVSVTEPADVNVSVDAGNLVLINDEGVVKVASGINTLITLSAEKTDDMKQIAYVEAMHLIYNDISATCKEYIGAFKNKYDNQVLIISAINVYFKDLEKLDVLDNRFKNTCDVDVETQKAAWKAAGTNVDAWDDQTVKNNSFRRNLYFVIAAKILGAAENFYFKINLA